MLGLLAAGPQSFVGGLGRPVFPALEPRRAAAEAALDALSLRLPPPSVGVGSSEEGMGSPSEGDISRGVIRG